MDSTNKGGSDFCNLNTFALQEPKIHVLDKTNFYVTSKCYVTFPRHDFSSGSSGPLTCNVCLNVDVTVNGP